MEDAVEVVKTGLSFSELTPDEAQYIWNCVAEQPAKLSYPLMKKLENQLISQGVVFK